MVNQIHFRSALLISFRIPSVTVNQDDGGQMEIEISDDPYDVQRLDVSSVPCIVSLSKVG